MDNHIGKCRGNWDYLGLGIPEIRGGAFIMEVPIGRIIAFWLISGSILGPLILGNGHVTLMIVMKDGHWQY